MKPPPRGFIPTFLADFWGENFHNKCKLDYSFNGDSKHMFSIKRNYFMHLYIDIHLYSVARSHANKSYLVSALNMHAHEIMLKKLLQKNQRFLLPTTQFS